VETENVNKMKIYYRYRVSVVMPCYNADKYIGEAIQSIINQSLADWELIIIDDGSTDDTIEKIKMFKDLRIKLIQLKKNYGNYYARNIGIKASSGKYLAMFDSDDISHLNRLELQYDYLESRPRTGAIGTSFHYIDSQGVKTGFEDRACGSSVFKVHLISNNFMLQSTIFIRSHLVEKYKLMYSTNYVYASDYDFVFQCSKYFKIYNLADYCVSYRVHYQNITHSKRVLQQECAFQIRRDILNYYFGDILSASELRFVNELFQDNRSELNLSYVESIFNKMLMFNMKSKSLKNTELYKFLYKEFTVLAYKQVAQRTERVNQPYPEENR